MPRNPRPKALVWLLLGAAVTTTVAVACSHDWDGYDPRLGTSSVSASSGSTGGGASQSATASASVSSTTAGGGGGDAGDAGGGAGGSDADAGPLTYRDIILADGPIAYFRFDDAQGPAIVDEVGAHPGAASVDGVTYKVPGALAGNAAISFDGVSGLITVPNLPSFTGIVPYTFEMWIKLAIYTEDYPRVISKEIYSPLRQGYVLYAGEAADGGKATGFERFHDDTRILATFASKGLSTTKWSQLIARFDGVELSMFIDAVKVSSNGPNDGGIPDTSVELVIGATSQHSSHFAGALDEMAIYDKALSDQRIIAHYNAALAGP